MTTRWALVSVLAFACGCGDDAKGGAGAGAGGMGTGGAGAGGMGAGGAGAGGAGAGGMGVAFASCTTFDDHTAAADPRAISTMGFNYAPKCIQIKAGQSVNIAASSVHPLKPGPQAGNPIPAMSTSPVMVTFNVEGVFGYFCMNHGAVNGTGMAGAIQVVP